MKPTSHPSIEVQVTRSERDFLQIRELVEAARDENESWALAWTSENLRDEFEKATTYVATVGAERAGFMFIRPPGAAWEITLVAVAVSFRGQGVLEALVGKCGASLIHLEVRADNRFAIEAYERLGFRVVGRRAQYYQDGVDAVLYTRD